MTFGMPFSTDVAEYYSSLASLADIILWGPTSGIRTIAVALRITYCYKRPRVGFAGFADELASSVE